MHTRHSRVNPGQGLETIMSLTSSQTVDERDEGAGEEARPRAVMRPTCGNVVSLLPPPGAGVDPISPAILNPRMRPGVLPMANTGAPRPLMPMRSRRGLPKSSRLAMSNGEVKFDPRLDPDPHPTFRLCLHQTRIPAQRHVGIPAVEKRGRETATAHALKFSVAGIDEGEDAPRVIPASLYRVCGGGRLSCLCRGGRVAADGIEGQGFVRCGRAGRGCELGSLWPCHIPSA